MQQMHVMDKCIEHCKDYERHYNKKRQNQSDDSYLIQLRVIYLCNDQSTVFCLAVWDGPQV